MSSKIWFPCLLSLLLIGSSADAAGPSGLQAKIHNTLLPHARALAQLPAVIKAVEEGNTRPRGSMTNQEWKRLLVTDPLVQAYSTNAAAKALEKHKAPYDSEIFVSAADGTKVAFLEKPSLWDHANLNKHRKAMRGKTWIGKVELDESSGAHQLQVSVPVRNKNKIIGTIVVGADVTKL